MKGANAIALVRILRSFEAFFSKLDERQASLLHWNRVPYPKYLLGLTDRRTANTARRLGFRISNRRYSDGGELGVVADTNDVRRKVVEILSNQRLVDIANYWAKRQQEARDSTKF